MGKKKPHVVPGYIIYGIFVLGLISAVAFRAIIVFEHLNPLWVRPVWYVGILGYLVFFFYRYLISKRRKRAIEDYSLIEKVKANACLSAEDREVVIYLLSSIEKSLEDVNYYIIFMLSILAIMVDMAFVFLT
jgi:hypothetical protein